MRIDKKSIRAIIGKCNTVLVYGLKSCGYHQLTDALNTMGITALEHSTYPDKLNHSQLDDYLCYTHFTLNANNRCKGILSYHLSNNYLRIKNGMPAIPILFCIELDEIGSSVKVNMSRVIKNCDSDGGVTNAELKRIYKIYTDIPELRDLIDKTIHFVKLRQDRADKNHYFIDKIPAPWQSEVWRDTWKSNLANRMHTHKSKPCQWREAIKMKITMFDSRAITPGSDSLIRQNVSDKRSDKTVDRYFDSLWGF